MNALPRMFAVLSGLLCVVTAMGADYAAVLPGTVLQFPRDHGSHPQFRTEWWYVTGWLRTVDGESLGFQITYFRTRPDLAPGNPSAFAPTQLIIAHAALSDARQGRLWKDQRIARAALGLAGASTDRMEVWLDRWRLEQRGAGMTANVTGGDFALALQLDPSQPPLLNGLKGCSQKGPAPRSASHYYSLPHLRVTGTITRQGREQTVTGEAWLDHEWSSEYLDAQATGWDWTGINLADGGALMLFRIRDAAGTNRWAGGTRRDASGKVHVFGPHEVAFTPGRRWRSPRTGTLYPVEWTVTAGDATFVLKPLLDDQENDARLSTGAIYWEGAVTALQQGVIRGRGYLELTGYGEPLKLP
ncbi:MAG: lipocalin-like domain-containing protein [Steroidobacteraceae bacterium]